MRMTPTGETLGATVEGVDLAKPLNHRDFAAVLRALGEYSVLRFPAQDYGNLLGHAQAAGMGIINIRVLAGGALSGTEERHPLGSPPPAPIGSGSADCSWPARYRRRAHR